MNSAKFRWVVVSVLGLGGILASATLATAAQDEVASIQQLKVKALESLKSGDFDQTHELIARAASLSDDPRLAKMAEWTRQFEQQRETFAAQRRDEYQKRVREVLTLLEHGRPEFAIDVARNAYLLAEDKEQFNREPWLADLVETTVGLAEQYEAEQQWVKALRIYSDLGSVQPADPIWKDRLKLVTRRIRMLALYAPDELKSIQESDANERKEIERILQSATQPSTQPSSDAGQTPATQPVAANELEELSEENFRVDWRETLQGIEMDMLWEALIDSKANYYRDVDYRGLILGGLNGLRALATTNGLEASFAQLGDVQKRTQFLQVIDEQIRAADAAEKDSELLLSRLLSTLKTINQETIQLPEEVLVSEFADGALAELDDFTSMIWPADLAEFNKSTQGEFSGVGIQIELDDDGSLKVQSPLPDTPAFRAGIRAGDIITHINGKSAKGITLNQAVKHITGPTGTMVKLTVRSLNGDVKEHEIRREKIKVASIKGWELENGGDWDYLVDPEQRIGYIRLTNFTKDTSHELDRALRELEKDRAQGLILDLRYNPGGLLNTATEVTDRFLADGLIVSTRADRETPNPSTETNASFDSDEIEFPIVVLVNQYSASASEIVSGALKDRARALVVGERTFGKGSVQMLFPLSNRRAYLKLTTSHYYLPSGRCIHREENSQEWGVDPDVKVEMTPEQMNAAIELRQTLDILRDANSPPAEGEHRKLQDVAAEVQEAVEQVAEKEPSSEDLLMKDPQLSAALLLLRLELAGEPM